MNDVRLTTASYVVLGLVEFAGPATPYDLKQLASVSVNYFWSVPHTQLYAECERLAAEGLLTEQRESTGRRRRVYSITPAGTAALDAWRAETAEEFHEMRDMGVLKLFFGADRRELAVSQTAAHKARLKEYELIAADNPGMAQSMRDALEAGIAYEHHFAKYWEKLGRE